MATAEESLREHMAQYDPTPQDEEIAAWWYANSIGEDQKADAAFGWGVTDASAADWAVRRIAEARRHVAEVDELYQRQLEQLQAWRTREWEAQERTIAFFEAKVAEYHKRLLEENPKAKTVALPHGKLVARQTPDRVEVEDRAVAALPPQYQRITIAPDKRAILAHIKETGELLEGVHLFPGEVKFSVKTEEDGD